MLMMMTPMVWTVLKGTLRFVWLALILSRQSCTDRYESQLWLLSRGDGVFVVSGGIDDHDIRHSWRACRRTRCWDHCGLSDDVRAVHVICSALRCNAHGWLNLDAERQPAKAIESGREAATGKFWQTPA